MKEGIHPNYREVLFVDQSNGFKFVTRSCVNTKETAKTDDGRELPLFKLDTSSESHPFYTGTQNRWTTWAAASRGSATASARRRQEIIPRSLGAGCRHGQRPAGCAQRALLQPPTEQGSAAA